MWRSFLFGLAGGTMQRIAVLWNKGLILYHSNWLAKRFKAGLFVEGAPGDFTLQYNVYAGDVHALIIALGNNP